MYSVFCLFLFSSLALAHQTSLTPGGSELYWSNPSVPMVIRTNTNDMSSAEVRSIIQSSMDQWNQSSSAKVNSVASSVNEVKFVSNFPYGSAVLGVTELSYNSSGAIQKAVISLNDDYFFRASSGLYPSGEVFLGDVVTHELGHVFGMSHSEVLNSSMFYSSFSGQSTLAFDDKTGVRKKYDTGHGSISGYVKGGSNIGVLGAQVQAVSRRTGEVSAVISDEQGFFSLDGLDLGDTYYLYTSPVRNANSLPGYFSNVQDEFCPASYVGSFFSACGKEHEGKPFGINLSHQTPSVDVGTVTINCSLKSDPAYNLRKLEDSFAPQTVYDYSVDQKHEKAFVGWFRKTSSSSWSTPDVLEIDLTSFTELTGTNKYVKLALVSYPFGSQLEYEMTVRMNGTPLTAATRTLSYSTTTETFQTDFNSIIQLSTNPSVNNFQVNLRSRPLTSSYVAQTFPSFNQFSSDAYLPYLLIASLWELTPEGLSHLMDNQVNLSDNSACLDAPFTYAVNKAQTISNASKGSQDAVAAGAACGTIDPPGSGPGNSLPLMTLGFLLGLMATAVINSRKKFLS